MFGGVVGDEGGGGAGGGRGGGSVVILRREPGERGGVGLGGIGGIGGKGWWDGGVEVVEGDGGGMAGVVVPDGIRLQGRGAVTALPCDVAGSRRRLRHGGDGLERGRVPVRGCLVVELRGGGY